MEKNIFTIPTTEPSYVYLVKNINVLALTSKDPDAMEQYGSGTHNQQVYITNKDFYDRGDWCIDIESEEIFKVAEVKEFSGIVRSDTNTYVYDACAKIVLTTDLKLIEDGVKEIDRDFLDWFVGFRLGEIIGIEVEKTPLLSNNGRALYGYAYKTIIPPKQEVSVRLNNSLNQFNLSLEEAINTEPFKLKEIGFGNKSIIEIQKFIKKTKQETLQENAKRILANNIDGLRDALQDDDLFFFYKGVVQCYGEAMAKWQKKHSEKSVSISDLEDGYQQELFNYLHSELDVIALQSQMHDIERIVDSMPSKNIYSEEDMREMYNKSCGLIGLGELNDQTENNNRFRELIEKIKNK